MVNGKTSDHLTNVHICQDIVHCLEFTLRNIHTIIMYRIKRVWCNRWRGCSILLSSECTRLDKNAQQLLFYGHTTWELTSCKVLSESGAWRSVESDLASSTVLWNWTPGNHRGMNLRNGNTSTTEYVNISFSHQCKKKTLPSSGSNLRRRIRSRDPNARDEKLPYIWQEIQGQPRSGKLKA